jgi:ADP-ribosylglycohydrolase
MLGAIVGDIIGSTREVNNIKNYNFDLFPPGTGFTDDSVLSIAVADCLLFGRPYVDTFKTYFKKYQHLGWGGNFIKWASGSNVDPYNSFGNGSAMRVSSVGWAYNSLEKVVMAARKSAMVTHNHVEGVRGAVAVAAAIFLARNGYDKNSIRDTIHGITGYNLTRKLCDIAPGYKFDVSCQGSVPEAIIAFLESNDFEDAIRKAVSIGGDSDTIACMCGGIAEAFYGGVPQDIADAAVKYLDPELLKIVTLFRKKCVCCRR